MLSLASMAFGVVLAADGAGAVRVRASGPGLAVVAHGAPLSVVLEEIGRHSGIRVTYEGVAPATPLTCDFLAASPAEAFLRALEGNGLNYALYGGTADVPGILLVSAPSGAAAAAPTRTAVTAKHPEPTRHPEPSAEVATQVDSPDEESLPLVAPPPGGAIPPRFMRQGEQPVSEGGGGEESALAPSEPGMNQPPDIPLVPSFPNQGERARDGIRRNRPGHAGNPQN